MLGNRFSFTASAFVLASACSAILSGPTASAQQYQQTNYPQYSATSLPKLSTQATQAPVFSDTQNDATAMSPDGWGESAIRSPFAGYQPQPTTVQQTVVQQNAAARLRLTEQAEALELMLPERLTRTLLRR